MQTWEHGTPSAPVEIIEIFTGEYTRLIYYDVTAIKVILLIGQCATVVHDYDNDKGTSINWRYFVDKTVARLAPGSCTVQCSPNS